MANLAHPIDLSLADFATVRRNIVGAFLADHRLSDVERATLAAFDEAVAEIREFRAKERLADYWLRNGNLASNYGRDLTKDAGATITRLEKPMEQKARVVRLDDHRNGPDAA